MENDTALGANVENTTKRNHMAFISQKYKAFYFVKRKKIRQSDEYV